jgi:hypothetical protein
MNIAIKRILGVLTSYPVISMGTFLITLTFGIAEVPALLYLDTKRCMTVLSVLFFTTLLVSLKAYPVLPPLIRYAKSRFMQRSIRSLFFVKRAIRNTLPFFLFNLLVLKGVIQVEALIYVPVSTVFSWGCSFVLMYRKHTYMQTRIGSAPAPKVSIPPLIKSTVYDYGTADFFAGALIAVFLFMAMLLDVIRDRPLWHTPDNPSLVCMGLAAVLSFSFMGSIDSIPHINWHYYAIISPQDFSFHVKQGVLFLAGFSGMGILAFMGIASSFRVPFPFA